MSPFIFELEREAFEAQLQENEKTIEISQWEENCFPVEIEGERMVND